jgi:hypothetical protein
MKLRNRSGAAPPAGTQEQETGRLSGVRPLPHDDDDRPRREDVTGGGHPMGIPVPLPRFFFPKSRRRPRG